MSSDHPAIRVSHLGKQYRLGGPQEQYLTFRDAIVNTMKAPLKAFKPAKPDEVFWALKDVSFEVQQGDVVGIIGRNGAGKSTLLKILSRITTPTEGTVELHGRVGSLLEVGTGFHPEMTGRENIFLNGSILGMKKTEIEEKFDEIVKFSEIEKFLDTPVKRYSSGMYVRLAFAVAAHLEPEILLIDEVLAVGDLEFQKRCIHKINDITQQGRTVILVSHNMSTIKSLCTRAILLDHGKITASAPVNTVVASYLSTNKPDKAVKMIQEKDYIMRSNKIKINKIILQNPVTDSFCVYWNQHIIIYVEIEVFERIEDASFGCGIRTVDGIPVLSVHHDDNGMEKWNFNPGKYELNFTLENDLRPGLYKFGVGAHEKYISKNLFYIQDAIDLEVLDFSEDGLIPIPYNSGIVNGRSKWENPIYIS